jgi:hypothetical protein
MPVLPLPVLVVTPTLGDSPWLAMTVESVALLPVRCTHVLVCPSDKVAELAARFPATLVVAELPGRRGMYAAVNAGIAAAGDWEAFTYINDDDLLLPDFATVVRAAANAAGRPLVAHGGVRLIDATGRRLGAIPISPRPALNRALYAQRIEPVYQQGTLVTRAAMDALGGFDESFRFCGDSEFLARACVTGVPFVPATRRPVAAFRLRPGQLTKDRAAMRAERAQVDAKLGLLAPLPAMERWRAKFVFRAANLPIYAERVARHGFVSFDELLAQP